MQQPLIRASFGYLHGWRFTKRGIYDSSPKFTNPAAAVGRQDRVKINNESLISKRKHFDASLSQSHQLSASESSEDSASSMPLLDALSGNQRSTATLEAAMNKLADELSIDKTGPLPFEEVPGPAIFKLWEKYWKYVPLFGTQLFRSVLINGLTEGRLLWNRNITPMTYLFNEYGPVVRLNGPFSGDIVLIHRPEHIAKIFEEEGDIPSRSKIDILHHYRLNHRKYRFAGPFCADGTQATEWLQTKKTLDVPISEQINKQFGKIEMACDELILRIRQIRNRQDEVPNNFNEELSRWGMECFWVFMLNKKMGFLESTGYNESSETTRFIEALNDAHLHMSRCETGFQVWRFMETPFSRRLFSSCNVIDGIIGKYIRIAQSNLRGEGVIRDEEDKQIRSTVLENLMINQRMTPDDVSTVLMDMIILGVQATTNSQAFLLYYLAKNPRVQKKLFDEITCKLRKDPELSRKTFDEMPYLSACIKECLRLRPSFPYITRVIPKTITLHGYKIPKDTYLIMANQIASLREENFEDPDKFRPERWLKPGDDNYPKNSYLPFGKGLRSCIGETIANLEIMMLTTKLIREFRVEYDYMNINSKFLMINVPNRPLRFRFVDRD